MNHIRNRMMDWPAGAAAIVIFSAGIEECNLNHQKRLSKFLRVKRIEAGFSQSELGKLLGNVHPQFISNWERGVCAPPSHCLKNLIFVLNIKKHDLMEIMIEDSKREIRNQLYSAHKLAK